MDMDVYLATEAVVPLMKLIRDKNVVNIASSSYSFVSMESIVVVI